MMTGLVSFLFDLLQQPNAGLWGGEVKMNVVFRPTISEPDRFIVILRNHSKRTLCLYFPSQATASFKWSPLPKAVRAVHPMIGMSGFDLIKPGETLTGAVGISSYWEEELVEGEHYKLRIGYGDSWVNSVASNGGWNLKSEAGSIDGPAFEVVRVKDRLHVKSIDWAVK